MKKLSFIAFVITLCYNLSAQNTFPTTGPAVINYDAGAALKIKNWNRFGSTFGGHYPYWGMNVEHTSSGWQSFHSSLRGSLILNWGNKTYFSSVPPNTITSSPTNHLVIDNVNNKVGIGTDSPIQKLQVHGNIYSVGGVYYADNGFGLRNSVNDFGVYPYTTHLQFRYNGQEAMRIDNTGKVGIGTSSPYTKLDVNGSFRAKVDDATASAIDIDYHNGMRRIAALETGGLNARPLKIQAQELHLTDDTATRMLIDNAGRIGIGTSSPSANVHVLGDQMKIENAGNGRGVKINSNGEISQLAVNGSWLHFQRYEDGPVVVGNNSSSNLYIPSGKVGIGTTAPEAKLDVRNGHAYIGDESFNNPGGWGATLNIDDNVHSRVLLEERDSGVQTSLAAHTGGRAEVGTISHHDFSLITNNQKKLTVLTNGFVGLGTTSASAKLDVRNGHAYIGDDTFDNPGSWGATLNIDDNVHSRVLVEERDSGVQTSLAAHTGGRAEVGTISHHDFSIVTNNSKKMTISTNGKVGIGTSTPGEKLEVNGNARILGNIYSKKVKVSNDASNWPDYVFESDYKLRPLSQVEAYVKTNKHLPEVPAAKEVEAKGQDLGKIQATLLKKVEELTLYLIEQDKKQLSLEERLKKLEEENAKLKALLKK